MTGHSGKSKLYSFHPEAFEDEKIIFACSSLMDEPKGVSYQGREKPLALSMELDENGLSRFRIVLEILGARYYYDVYEKES